MNNLFKTFLTYLMVLFLLSGCSLFKKKDPEGSTTKTVPKPYLPPQINMTQLQSKLRMYRPKTNLGFQEKRFDACDLGLTNSHCRNRHFSTLHFKIVCRDSKGTVEYVSKWELKPMRARSIQWIIGPNRGYTRTDSEGFGQIRTISRSSSGRERFILKKGKKSLALRANEVRRIVVPKDWCA